MEKYLKVVIFFASCLYLQCTAEKNKEKNHTVISEEVVKADSINPNIKRFLGKWKVVNYIQHHLDYDDGNITVSQVKALINTQIELTEQEARLGVVIVHYPHYTISENNLWDYFGLTQQKINPPFSLEGTSKIIELVVSENANCEIKHGADDRYNTVLTLFMLENGKFYIYYDNFFLEISTLK